MAIGEVGDAGVRAVSQQEKIFVKMILKTSDCPSE
ncbi:hypothetical protein PR002_g13170 [Phytophthora rubi]|uniref:V-ATPase proteolipid subunit C-like domain-containing protein n=1 Tax=Phytophthora rubi TaxID=129364 RepID=A0A6A3LPS8_9STRA|nr:hypothetical protein PR002_g13170 [Phytophthora rubi]